MKHRLPRAKSSTSRLGAKSDMEQAELLIEEKPPQPPPDSGPPRSGPPPLPSPLPPPEIPVNEPDTAADTVAPAETGASAESESYGFVAESPQVEEETNDTEVVPEAAEPRRATPPPLPIRSLPPAMPPPLPPRLPPPLPLATAIKPSSEIPQPAADGAPIATGEMTSSALEASASAGADAPPSAEAAPAAAAPPPASEASPLEASPRKLTSDTAPIDVGDEAQAEPEPGFVYRPLIQSVEPSAPLPPPLFTPKPAIAAEDTEEDDPNHAPYLIQTQGLVKQYGGRRVVNGVDIHVRAGEVVGLLGKNGAGKTTTFYMIVGLVPPTLGHVFMGDEDVTRMPMYRRARRGIGYLPQEESIFRKLTVEENLLAILETLPMTEDEREIRCDELLKDFGLEHVRENVAITLSGGEKRRVTIARALVTSPTLLLLDEPFSGVDPMAVHDIQEIILHLKERGLGVLITDHNVRETLSVVDRAYIIDEGRVLSTGTREFLLNDPVAREIYLGHRFSM